MSSYVPKRVDLRRRVYALLGQMKKIDVVKHFQIESIPHSTIYRIIKRFEDNLPMQRQAKKRTSIQIEYWFGGHYRAKEFERHSLERQNVQQQMICFRHLLGNFSGCFLIVLWRTLSVVIFQT